jgi:hypothetical protein
LVQTQIGDPVPGEHAFHGHDEVFAKRSDRAQKGLRASADLAVIEDLSCHVENAQVEAPGVEVWVR